MINVADYLSAADWLIALLYFMLILFGAWAYRYFTARNNPLYRWLLPALAFKMLGGTALLAVYGYYYGGGDVFAYFDNTRALAGLTLRDPGTALYFLAGNNHLNDFNTFSFWQGNIHQYLYIDSNTWAVSRFSYPFALLGMGRILSATLLMNVVALIGPWKLFKLLCERYPSLQKQLALAILFIPSCIFWGSGMMKDGFTYSATLWFLYAALQIFLFRRFSWMRVLLLIANAYVIISIKPYIFIALMPALLMFMLYGTLRSIPSRLLRYVLVPVVTLLISGGGIALYSALSPSLGKYGSFEQAFEKAAVSRDDFVQNQTYSANYFDIGSFDPTPAGILSKAHLALLYGLFGPFPWQANNVVMYISSLEAMAFLGLFLTALYHILFRGAYRRLVADPVQLAFLLFVLVFIVFVGVSTANFGSLVRYRIPALPMFAALLFMMIKVKKMDKK